MGNSISSSTQSIENTFNNQIFMPPLGWEKYYDQKGEININSINGSNINGYIIEQESEKYIIWSHGNAATIYFLKSYFEHLSNKLQVNIVAYDYQGYGKSEGTCSEQNCYEDLESVINYLVNDNNVNKENIILIGRSLGTGVTMNYISNNEWNTPVMLISPYTSIMNVAHDLVSSTNCFESSFLFSVKPIDKFKSIDKIANTTCPIKIIHGDNDNIINISQGRKLWDNLPNKIIEPLWIENVGHNDILEVIPLSAFEELLY